MKSSILLSVAVLILSTSANGETTVRFRLVHGFAIIVPVMINNSGPYDFLLDTGTNTSMISRELADKYSLRIVDQACLHTIAGTQTVPRGYLDRMTLGRKSVLNLEVMAADVSGARRLDSDIAGILGLNFLGRFNYIIDYDNHL